MIGETLLISTSRRSIRLGRNCGKLKLAQVNRYAQYNSIRLKINWLFHFIQRQIAVKSSSGLFTGAVVFRELPAGRLSHLASSNTFPLTGEMWM